MNREEWIYATRKSHGEIKVTHKWSNKTRQIQRSLQYNPDPNATVRHHLMDTPEQIEYNNAHYELWGHNLDGTFEYGKYIIFITPEEHGKINANSEEINKKISQKVKDSITPECRKKMSEVAKNLWMNEEYRDKVLTTTHSEEYRSRKLKLLKQLKKIKQKLVLKIKNQHVGM